MQFREESPLPIYDRLAEDDRIAKEEAERKRKEKEQKEEEELKALSFAPKIPRKSISIAKRSSIIGDADVYQRLLHTPLESHKLNESIAESTVSIESDTKKVVLPEKNIQEICRRLSVTQIGRVEPPPSEVKKVVLPPQDVNTIFNRLQKSRTKSFILKYDTEEAERFIREHSDIKEGPKLSQPEMESVLERLRNHQTTSSGVYQEIGVQRRQSISANNSPLVRRESFSTSLSPMRRESFSNNTSPAPIQRTLSRMSSTGSMGSVGSINTYNSAEFNIPTTYIADPAAREQRASSSFVSPPKYLSAMNIFAQVSDEIEECKMI